LKQDGTFEVGERDRVEAGRKPRPGLKLGFRVAAVVQVRVEAGRKPRPGLKHDVRAVRRVAGRQSRQGENPDRD